MGTKIKNRHARFHVGQPIKHKLFDYRGVVVDVDASFQGSKEWYDRMARSRAPRDAPWYHILVDGADDWTYVAERNLRADMSGLPIDHPDVREIFDCFADGRYHSRILKH